MIKQGSKFCAELAVKPPQLLVYARNVSGKVDTREQEVCLQDSVKAVTEGTPACSKKVKVRPVIYYSNDNDLELLVADRSGGFDVVPQCVFCEKTRETIKKGKLVPKRLCDSPNLTGLSNITRII